MELSIYLTDTIGAINKVLTNPLRKCQNLHPGVSFGPWVRIASTEIYFDCDQVPFWRLCQEMCQQMCHES